MPRLLEFNNFWVWIRYVEDCARNRVSKFKYFWRESRDLAQSLCECIDAAVQRRIAASTVLNAAARISTVVLNAAAGISTVVLNAAAGISTVVLNAAAGISTVVLNAAAGISTSGAKCRCED